MADPTYATIPPTSTTAATYPVTVLPSVTYAAGATNGVAMMPPGSSILSSVKSAVSEACKEIPADKHVALVAVTSTVNGEVRSNLALAARVGDTFEVKTWVAKTWKKDSALEWGAQVVLSL